MRQKLGENFQEAVTYLVVQSHQLRQHARTTKFMLINVLGYLAGLLGLGLPSYKNQPSSSVLYTPLSPSYLFPTLSCQYFQFLVVKMEIVHPICCTQKIAIYETKTVRRLLLLTFLMNFRRARIASMQLARNVIDRTGQTFKRGMVIC